jgi:hypothetical protein
MRTRCGGPTELAASKSTTGPLETIENRSAPPRGATGAEAARSLGGTERRWKGVGPRPGSKYNTHIYIHICTYISLYHIHTYTRTSACTYIYIYQDIYTYIYIYIYMHIGKRACTTYTHTDPVVRTRPPGTRTTGSGRDPKPDKLRGRATSLN